MKNDLQLRPPQRKFNENDPEAGDGLQPPTSEGIFKIALEAASGRRLEAASGPTLNYSLSRVFLKRWFTGR